MHKNKYNPDKKQSAFKIVQKTTRESLQSPSKADISRIMAHMGRKGGLKGGKARAESLSAKDRKSIAQKAAQTRWKNS